MYRLPKFQVSFLDDHWLMDEWLSNWKLRNLLCILNFLLCLNLYPIPSPHLVINSKQHTIVIDFDIFVLLSFLSWSEIQTWKFKSRYYVYDLLLSDSQYTRIYLIRVEDNWLIKKSERCFPQGPAYLLLEREFHDPDQKLVGSRGIQTCPTNTYLQGAWRSRGFWGRYRQ